MDWTPNEAEHGSQPWTLQPEAVDSLQYLAKRAHSRWWIVSWTVLEVSQKHAPQPQLLHCMKFEM